MYPMTVPAEVICKPTSTTLHRETRSSWKQEPLIAGRVSPSQAGLLAKLRSNAGGDPIIRTASGAHHYKLIGLDISTRGSAAKIQTTAWR
jgi:hypothetical protein